MSYHFRRWSGKPVPARKSNKVFPHSYSRGFWEPERDGKEMFPAHANVLFFFRLQSFNFLISHLSLKFIFLCPVPFYGELYGLILWHEQKYDLTLISISCCLAGGFYSWSSGSTGGREGRGQKATGGGAQASHSSPAPGQRHPKSGAAAPQPNTC